MNYWHAGGAPLDKLVVGMATYGRCFNPTTSDNSVGAPSKGACPAGQFTREAGFLAYYEVGHPNVQTYA